MADSRRVVDHRRLVADWTTIATNENVARDEVNKTRNGGDSQEPDRRASKDDRSLFVYALIGLASFACYANNTSGQFVHDDVKAITNNPDVRGETPLLALFGNDFWGKSMSDPTSHKSYRPLCVLTFRLNNALFRGGAAGYHIVNNVLHSFVTMLFTHVCRHVVFSGDLISSAIAGLLFATHPIHTEAVSGIVGRADILCSLFFLLSFFTYQRLLTSGCRPRRGSMSFIGSVFYATLALLSKEQGITVLGVSLIYESLIIWQSLRMADVSLLRNNKSEITKGIKRILLLTFSSLALVIFRLLMLGGSFPKFQEEDNPASFSPHLLTRILTYAYLWSFSCWLMLCPSQLSHDWQMGSIPLVSSVGDTRNIVSLSAIVLVASLTRHTICCEKTSHQKRMCFGLTFLVLPFLLFSNIFVTVGFVVAERVLYLPSMGLIILVTTGVDLLRRRYLRQYPRFVKMLLILVLVGVLACRTVMRNQVWLSRESLARSGLQALPRNAKMHYNYANLLAARGHISEAVRHYKTAVSLWPSYISAHNNLAHYMTNKTEALLHLTEVIRLQPCHANAYTNIADIYHRSLNETEAAIELLRFAAECEPTNPSPHLSLATIHEELGRPATARSHFAKALQLAPRQAEIHHNVGLFYERQGQHERAVRHLEKAAALDPSSVASLRALAGLHRKTGRNSEAEKCFAKILALRRDAANLDMVATFYFNTGNAHKATELFADAYRLEATEDIAVHLSQALSVMLRYDEAEALLKKHIGSGYLPLTTQLANVYGLKKEHQKAIDLLNEFKNTKDLSKKESSAIHHQIGNHLKDMNQWYMAFQNYHKAVELDPDNAESHHNLAVYFHRQALYDKAIHHYLSAIRLRPEDNLLQKNYKSLLDLYRPSGQPYTASQDGAVNGTNTAMDGLTGQQSRLVYVVRRRNDSGASVTSSDSVTLDGRFSMLRGRGMSLAVESESP